MPAAAPADHLGDETSLEKRERERKERAFLRQRSDELVKANARKNWGKARRMIRAKAAMKRSMLDLMRQSTERRSQGLPRQNTADTARLQEEEVEQIRLEEEVAFKQRSALHEKDRAEAEARVKRRSQLRTKKKKKGKRGKKGTRHKNRRRTLALVEVEEAGADGYVEII